MTAKESWKPVTIGGVTGILMGAGAMYAAKTTTVEVAEAPELAKAETNGVVKEAASHDEMSFGDAFEAARAAVGAGGVFRRHGHIYNTYTEEEWGAMSNADKQVFAQRVSPEVSAHSIDTKQIVSTATPTKDHHDATVTHNPGPDETATVKHEPPSDPANGVKTIDEPKDGDDVRLVRSGVVQLPDGQYVAVEELDMNGQRVAVIDLDNDGVGDIAMSDMNHNNIADEGEIIDLHTGEPIAFTNDDDDTMLYTSDDTGVSDGADVDSTVLL